MTQVIDIQQALEQAAGNEELAKELFGMLLKELPVLKQKLGTAISNSNLTECWDHAHKLYGSTAYCGVPALREAVQVMESAIKAEEMTRIERKFSLLSGEIDRVLEQGEKILSSDWIS